MMVGSNFPGDEDRRIKDVQFNNYSSVIGELVETARRRYIYAEELLELTGAMAAEIRKLRFFDHRTVQDTHDIIAAAYRFSRRSECLFDIGDPDAIAIDWFSFARKEIESLCEDPKFVRAVLHSAVYANQPLGYRGEKESRTIASSRYGEMREYTLPRVVVEPE